MHRVSTQPSVMVVADDADVLTALERGLRLTGFDMSTAKNVDEALLELVWGNGHFAADTYVVDAFTSNLRRKLDAARAPRLLHTVPGADFVLRVQS